MNRCIGHRPFGKLPRYGAIFIQNNPIEASISEFFFFGPITILILRKVKKSALLICSCSLLFDSSIMMCDGDHKDDGDRMTMTSKANKFLFGVLLEK